MNKNQFDDILFIFSTNVEYIIIVIIDFTN